MRMVDTINQKFTYRQGVTTAASPDHRNACSTAGASVRTSPTCMIGLAAH